MSADPVGFDPMRALELRTRGELDEATAYVKEFIDRGSAIAMIVMADFLFDQGDKAGSLAWIEHVERSMSDDDDLTPIYLASAYRRGLGHGTFVERHQKALGLLERVGESGNVYVMLELMDAYRHGLNGAPADYDRFAYWAKKAAAMGSEEAARILRRTSRKKFKSSPGWMDDVSS